MIQIGKKKTVAKKNINLDRIVSQDISVSIITDFISERKNSEIAISKSVKYFCFSVLLLLGISVALGFVLGGQKLYESQLKGEEIKVRNEANEMMPVGDYWDSYQSMKSGVTSLLSKDLNYNSLLKVAKTVVPSGDTITKLSSNPKPCQAPTPFETNSENAIGCIDITADGNKSSLFLDNLNNQNDTLVDGFLKRVDPTNYNITVNYTDKIYSNKYVDFVNKLNQVK